MADSLATLTASSVPAPPTGGDLVVERPEGLYCPPGDFHIDPWRPVERAVITHAHADHAHTGHGHYLASEDSEAVLRARLGEITLQTLPYGEVIEHRGVRMSLHPAGHVLGSAQVRLEYRGEVWVVSGDYYLAGDVDRPGDSNPTCPPFEPIGCHCFITESTFGLPVYRWPTQRAIYDEIDAWWRRNAEDGRASVLLGYSFGKAQRLLAGVDASIGPIYVHGAVEPINEAYRACGVALPITRRVSEASGREVFRGALIVAPPSVSGSPWMRRFTVGGEPPSDAFASGWMALRGARRRRGVDRGFVLSDHADWPGLHRAIAATGASRVIVTHGYEAVLVRRLQEQGLRAGAFHTEYRGDAGDDTAAAPSDDTTGQDNAPGSAAHPATHPTGGDPPSEPGAAVGETTTA